MKAWTNTLAIALWQHTSENWNENTEIIREFTWKWFYLSSWPWSINAYFTNSFVSFNQAVSREVTILSQMITWFNGYKNYKENTPLEEYKFWKRRQQHLHSSKTRTLPPHIQTAASGSSGKQDGGLYYNIKHRSFIHECVSNYTTRKTHLHWYQN